MARIAGVNIPDHKHAVISLTYIFGVGKTAAQKLCDATGVKPDAKVKDLSDEERDAVTAAAQASLEEEAQTGPEPGGDDR